MRILVTGGRDYDDAGKVFSVLNAVMEEFSLDSDPGSVTIVHGGAKGADTIAGLWCKMNKIKREVHMANWKEFGRRAGPMRNRVMLNSGVDLVLAFPTENSIGTWDMVKIARKAGVEVRVYE